MSPPGRAIFLSYASQDADAASRIGESLRAAGLEVWLDQSELRGGDAWDASIRARIRDCALFVPIVSANTEARGEGYFRLEWRLGVDRSQLMADDQPFLLPVVIDSTTEASARVPDAFRQRQWTRIPGARDASAFVERVKRLLDAPRDPAAASEPSVAARPATASRAQPHSRKAIATALGAASVAVLPFDNLSDDKANEYFSDGVSEELLNVLQTVSGLQVVARTSSFSFKGRSATAQEIGQKLGVAHIVEGSVRKSGKSVRIAARLVRAATGEQLWSDAYTRDLDDVFAVQSALARTIVEQLRGPLGGALSSSKAEVEAQIQSAAKGGSRNAEAHQLYLQGLFYERQSSLPTSAKAQVFLERAVAIDPQFALAWAALSSVGASIGGSTDDKPAFDAAWALARRASERALALEPDLPSAHRARMDIQIWHDFDWNGAIESLRRLRLLAPDDVNVDSLAARLNQALCRREEAVELARKVVARDPLNPGAHSKLGYLLHASGRPEEAQVHFQRVIELSPASPLGHAGVGFTLLARGRYEEAVREARRGSTEWSRLTVEAMALWALGKRSESDVALGQLTGRFAASQVAQVHAYRRENDRAFEWLERAWNQRDPGIAFFKCDPIFARLHADVRWHAFLRRAGLADDQLR